MKTQGRQRNSTMDRLILTTIIIAFLANTAWGETATKETALEISPVTIIDPNNISGVAIRDDFLILGSDKGGAIQVLNKSASNTYHSEFNQLIVLW